MDIPYSLIAPMVALVAWTIVVLFWAIIRIQTAARRPHSGFDVNKMPAGTRARDVEEHLPREASWPRQNYEHLVEQPTLFYAIVTALALMQSDHWLNVSLAWGYVGFRIIHSLQQIFGKVRAIGFVGSSLCLIALTVHGAIEVVYHL
ncbi:MAPEG family protein [Sphingomicrobium sp. XHP0239]|uniref:MAPEG family protein n=1 Tax=Sphingomicrobium maritimum TaxID=3133972 RepID=UPI0031CCD130